MKFTKTCCEFTKRQLEHHCDEHGDNCPDRVLKLSLGCKDEFMDIPPRFLLIAANAAYKARFCPYCGKNLIETCIPETPLEIEP
jgi:hypothetical protein